MEKIGPREGPKSRLVRSLDESTAGACSTWGGAARPIILPVLHLGGNRRGGIAYQPRGIRGQIHPPAACPRFRQPEVLIEESFAGWKEFRDGGVRPKAPTNCIIICSDRERRTPMGVPNTATKRHVRRPDANRQRLLRSCARSIACCARSASNTGGSNVAVRGHFPPTARLGGHRDNPRVSRSLRALPRARPGLPDRQGRQRSWAVGLTLERASRTRITRPIRRPSFDRTIATFRVHPRCRAFTFEKFPGAGAAALTTFDEIRGDAIFRSCRSFAESRA